MKIVLTMMAAAALLAGCASKETCRAPSEREMRQGQVQGLLASCKPRGQAAAPSTEEAKP